MAQFLPTFESASQLQRGTKLREDGEELDEVDIDPTLEKELAKTCFIFLVDRSNSMYGDSIEITKEALTLFTQSLPAGSVFQIISFGSKFELMDIG